MSRLVWALLGLAGGVALARNADGLNVPSKTAIVLVILAAGGLCWWAAYRGKSQAVATAVATAVASARAEAAAAADARAQAVAHQAVVIALGDPATALAGVADPRDDWTARRIVERVQAQVPAGGERAAPLQAEREARPADAIGYL